MYILPLTYLGNIEYFSLLATGKAMIDVGENYIKQSYRNRCYIMSANGAIPLTVNILRGDKPKCAVKDVRIDYSKRWQHQHWQAIVSTYKNSAFFDFYEELFHPFYIKKYVFLYDYNRRLIDLTIKLLELDVKVNYSEKYIESMPEDIDLRLHFSPKNSDARFIEQRKYYQVFNEKYPFTPNLSAIDLLFNEGRNAKDFLMTYL